MYRKSNKISELSLFSNSCNYLQGKSLKIYEDNNKWHNQFRHQVTELIDEDLFKPLYSENIGSPNASIRVLISMMILKEAHGWSDSQLFENCRFNILTRSALSLMNMDDEIPAESTYYLLRKRIVEWETKGNDNLIEKVFSQVTKSQVTEFQINGNKIRMDSKLLGSNIAWYSRYELIHEALSNVYCYLKTTLVNLLSETEIILLEELSSETGDKVCYRSNKTELESKMVQLGTVIYKIIKVIEDKSSKEIQILSRIFDEQYQIEKEVVTPRSKHEISAKSVQSPYDADCHYRKKDDQQVKGYSINATETCDTDKSLNLVTNVLVEPASAADCDFLQSATEATQEIICKKIETINADGAYHSIDNQNYCKEKQIDLILGGIQGNLPRYELVLDENKELIVTDLKTNLTVPCRKVQSRKDNTETKWSIKTEEGKIRYFGKKEIDTCELRKQIINRPQTELNVRNNVEATIFQIGFHYSNAKSRYRGLIKHKIWANIRCLWINFVRILNFIVRTCPEYAPKLKNRVFSQHILLNFVKNSFQMVTFVFFAYFCLLQTWIWFLLIFQKSDFLERTHKDDFKDISGFGVVKLR
jgi:hypothetical protein